MSALSAPIAEKAEMNNHPLADLFPMMDGAALAALAEDVRAHGLREPIVLIDGAILDGRNRHRACEIAGVEPRFREFAGGDPLAFVLSLNLERRHLNESQRAMIAARLETMKRGRPGKDATSRVLRADAAERLHVGERTVADAAKVLASAAPEIVDAVDEGRIAVSVAATAVSLPPERQRELAAYAVAGDPRAAQTMLKKEARAEREKALAVAQSALPVQKFGVILADPEWRFEVYSRETGLDRAADNHYPTSAVEVIAARDVPSIAAEDCVLFLWATAPMLPQALAVMEAWGFAYKAQATWGKDRVGTGYWFRNKHELLLVGVRGRVPAPAMGTQWASLIEAPTGEHSAKPEIFLDLIERYFPNLPKIELNRRGPPRPGWSAWGYEAEAALEAAAPSESVAGAEPVWWKEARRMRERGARIIDIATTLGRSPSTVHGALNGRGKARQAAERRSRRAATG
jgi:N6-adenosine-specific RNA methylase IME4